MYLEHSILCSENWILRKVDRKCIERFEVWSWRRTEKISWTDRVKNELVLQRVEEKRNIVHKTKQRNVNWIGYILRRNSLPLHVIQINIEGRMGVTGGRRRRCKELLNDLKEGRGHWRVKEAALDRTVWRTCFGSVYELVRERIWWWVKDWGESSSELMIVNKITKNCTQDSLAWVFCLLYMLYSNLSRVFCC